MNRLGALVFGLASGVVATFPASSVGQQVIVRTQATAVTGEVSRSDLVVADLEDEAFSAPLYGVVEPGERGARGIVSRNAYLWTLRDRDANDRLYELPCSPSPHPGPLQLQLDGTVTRFLVSPEAVRPATMAAVVQNTDEGSRLFLFRADAEGFFLTSPPLEVGLQGECHDLTWLDTLDAWGALCDTPEGVCVVASADGNTRTIRLPVVARAPETSPQVLTEMGDAILILERGYDLTRSDGMPFTAVKALNFQSQATVLQLAIPGALTAGPDSMVPGEAGTLWLVTEVPATGSATATQLAIGEDLHVQRLITLPSAAASFAVVALAEDDSLVFGCGAQLQRWTQAGQLLGSRSFNAPITGLIASDLGLLVAEGNRVHRIVTSTLSPDRTLHMYSGRIAEFWSPGEPLPGLGDADGDRAFDPIDTTPGTASPRLKVPGRISLRARAAGSELRTVQVELSVPRQGYLYRVREIPHGFQTDTLEAGAPGAFHIGLDPGYWAPGVDREAEYHFRIDLLDNGVSDPVDSAVVRAVVEPLSPVPCRILITPPSETDRYSALVERLRAAPQFYSVSTDPNPDPDSLGAYDMVIVSIDAMIGGRLPRVLLERYVADGGGLFLVASPGLARRLAEVREWLTPFRMDVRSARETLRAVRGDCDWCAVWSNAGLDDGLLATVEPPGEALFMPGRAAREGPMTRSPFGLGRVVFAGSDGLLNVLSSEPTVRDAVLDSIRWLARTSTDVRDSDGDGLADAVEDRNGNGGVDYGETAPLLSDTDGDFLPDGDEDLNGNGQVDAGETDPRLADTDGDRIPDGADTDSIPRDGAERATPGTRPGGTPDLLQ